MSDVAKHLGDRRRELGLSVTATARQAGITRAYLQRLERDDRLGRLSLDVLGKLSKVLQTTPAELLREDAELPLPSSLRTFVQETQPEPELVLALSMLARRAIGPVTRDDWMILARALQDTLYRTRAEWQEARRRERQGRIRFAEMRVQQAQDELEREELKAFDQSTSDDEAAMEQRTRVRFAEMRAHEARDELEREELEAFDESEKDDEGGAGSSAS